MNKPNQLEAFSIAVRSVHNTQCGTNETSYCTAIDNLLRGIGATLKPEELSEAQSITRRIAMPILLQPKLDANYASVIANVYPFPLATN
jgi:hypothetical protein